MRRPVLSDLVGNQIRQHWIAEQKPTSGRDSVRLVLKLFRPELVEVLEEASLDQLRVEPGNPVDGVRTDDGQVGHVDPLASFLLKSHEEPELARASPRKLEPHRYLNDGEDAHLVPVVVELGSDILHVEVVDLVDDLKMAREEVLHQVHRPSLEGLRQDGVVGVGAHLLGDVPGL